MRLVYIIIAVILMTFVWIKGRSNDIENEIIFATATVVFIVYYAIECISEEIQNSKNEH